MTGIPGLQTVRRRSTRYGILTAAAGLVLLVGLRVWASPIIRTATGRGSNGLLEFLLIPVFLGVVLVGVLLFLWEPDRPHAETS